MVKIFKKLKRIKKKYALRIVAAGLSVALVGQIFYMIVVNAAPDAATDVTVESVSLTDEEIDEASLIIGSYVININGITDEVYELAEESATQFNQTNTYYKSELADGQWFDVSDATSLSDIMTTGTRVDVSEIESLEFTHQVSETGTVTDLRYGYSVSSFDITSPYDLWDLEELDPIENQLELLQNKTSQTESDKAAIKSLQEFYGKSIRNSTTNNYDNIIAGLEKYKNGLSDRGKDNAWVDEVQKVMTYVDALRRVEAFTILSENLDTLLDEMGGQSGKPTYNDDGDIEEVDEFYTNSDLVSAIGDAIDNIETSITENSANILTEGSTETSQSRYKYTNDLMNSITVSTTYTYEYDNIPWYMKWYSTWLKVRAKAITSVSYDESSADTATQKLVDQTNISSGTIVDIDSEAATAKEMSEGAYEDYKAKLAAGVSEDYQNAVINGESESTKSKLLTDQKEDTDTSRNEYQNILSAYFERMSSTSTQQVIGELLDEIPDLEALVPNDAVASYQLETVYDHRDWLRDLLAKAMAESADSSEMDSLLDDLEDLENQRQQALDDNDLAKEKELTAEIDAKQTEIDNLTNTLLDTLASDNASESDKAKALAGLGDGTAAQTITELGNEIASAIRDSSGDGNGSGTNGDGTDGTDGSGNGTDGTGTGTVDGTDGDGTNGDGTNGSGNGNGSGSDGTGSDIDTSGINSDEGKDLLNKMSALSAMSNLDTDAANVALSAVEDALANASDLDSALAGKLIDSVTDTRSDIDSSLSRNASNLSMSELTAMVEEILGCDIEEASSLQLASAVLALSDFGYDYSNNNAKNLAISYANDMNENRDKYIYTKLKTSTEEYVSLKAVGAVLGYRYVFDDAHYTVTLSHGRQYNTFTKGHDDYLTTKDKTKTLKSETVYQKKTLYVISDDAYSIYQTKAGYVRGSDYAIAATPEVVELSTEVYNEMVAQLQ